MSKQAQQLKSSKCTTFNIAPDGMATWINKRESPTQSQLLFLAEKYRQTLTGLEILLSYQSCFPTLDFETIGVLPSLSQLKLQGLIIKSMSFTKENTPALECLDLADLSSPEDIDLTFDFNLPHLRILKLSYILVYGPSDFGLSVSRSPLLEIIYFQRVNFLTGPNYTLLPSCKTFYMYRSEGTYSLKILQAPKLSQIYICSCYSMEDVRLWDLPYEIKTEDVERLREELRLKGTKLCEETNEWLDRWKDGTYSAQDALQLQIIDDEQIDNFDAENEDTEDALIDYSHQILDKKLGEIQEEIWKKFVDEVSTRQIVFPEELLPNCILDHTGVSLLQETVTHLNSNRRLELIDES